MAGVRKAVKSTLFSYFDKNVRQFVYHCRFSITLFAILN